MIWFVLTSALKIFLTHVNFGRVIYELKIFSRGLIKIPTRTETKCDFRGVFDIMTAKEVVHHEQRNLGLCTRVKQGAKS